MPLRILVTGASGFIGSALVPYLKAKGHIVRAAARQPASTIVLPPHEFVSLPDLAGDVDWRRLVDGMDVVVHLAGIAHRGGADADLYDRAVRLATAQLAAACRGRKVKRLIFMSSIGAQTGSAADHVVTEEDEPKPVTAYDRAKLAAEKAIQISGAPFTILRPVIVYGAQAKGNVASLIRIAALPVPLPFRGFRNRRSFLAVENLVQAIELCLDTPTTLDETFVVADPEPIALADLLAELRAARGHSPRLFTISPNLIGALLKVAGREALWDRIGRELVVSPGKLKLAGWRPRVKTAEGLRAMMRAAATAG